MKKPNLLLVTNQFPFGLGEKSFILPELNILKESFNVTILSLASKEMLRQNELTSVFSEDVYVKHLDITNYSKWKALLSLIKSFLREALFRKEVFCTLFRGKATGRITRLYAVCASWKYSEMIYEWIRGNSRMMQDVDIVYTYWFHYATLSFLRFRENSKEVKYRVITRVHGYDLYESRGGMSTAFKRWMNRKIDRVFFISKHGKKYYLSKYGAADNIDKYKVFYLGSRRPVAANKNYESIDAFRIVSCSNVISVKRVGLIVDAISLLALKTENKIRWIHFGGGDEFESIVKRAKEKLSGSSTVSYSLTGPVPNDVIHEHYCTKGADVFINVSVSEGLPVSVMEAMSYGIPIIATDVGGTGEAINNNGALLSKNPSAEDVSNAIQKIMKLDKKKTEEIRSHSLNRWTALFDANKNAILFRNELLSITDHPAS